jgi:prepilin-type N-terminal cleavage/methylation domain-containing protein
MKNKSGFSLMEMMVVLLIVAIIAAASAPMINRKMVRSASGDSPWVWIGNNGAIGYNLLGASSAVAQIGIQDIPASANTSRLYINSDNSTLPQIGLGYSNQGETMKVFASNNSLVISTAADDTDLSVSDSVILGAGAKTGDTDVVVVGYNAYAGTTGAIAVGVSANAGNTSSIAIGDSAKASASNCIAIGSSSSASANNSTAFGHGVAASGEYSTALGYDSTASGYGSTASGHSSTASGYWSAALGYSSTASGTNSTALGYNSIASGYRSTALGDSAKASGTESYAIGGGAKASGEYSTALGYDAIATDDYSIVLGSSYHTVSIPGKLDVAGDITYGGALAQSSDRRLKNVGKVFADGLEKIRKLEVYNYTFKNDKNKTPRVGVLAQDLQKIFPNAVTKGDDGFLKIRMEDMFFAIVRAVQENDKRISTLEAQNKELLKRIEALEKRK